MLGTQHDSTVFDHPSKTFSGVRFVLLGFDPVSSQKVRLKLLNGGGVDVCHYGPNCTHVIVDKIIYDDPICVAARTDGKILVTGLWVDHSFDIGMPVDPTSIIYQPLKDLEGIPGAKSILACLTGYVRQDRDDIMTMVSLMGGTFSKSLVANKVTHLICYKFEGEKYELAKRFQRIKLVNHQWLADCLKAWEILSEANYDKSGYEVEMMEAEAKDSEEEEKEAQEIAKGQTGEQEIDVCPRNFQSGIVRAHLSPKSKPDVSMNLSAIGACKGVAGTGNHKETVLAASKETLPVQPMNLQDIHMVLGSRDIPTPGGVTVGEPFDQPLNSNGIMLTPSKVGNDLASTSGSAKRSLDSSSGKLSTKSYSRKTPRTNTLSPGKIFSSFPREDTEKFNAGGCFDISASKEELAKNGTDSGAFQTPVNETKLHHERVKSGMLSEKRKMEASYGSVKSQKMSHDPPICISGSPLTSHRSGGSEPSVLINVALEEKNATPGSKHNSPANIAASNFSSFNRKSLTKPVVNAVASENRKGDKSKLRKTSLVGLQDMSIAKEPGVQDVHDREENAVSEVGRPHQGLQDVQLPPPKSNGCEVEESNGPNLDVCKGKNVDSVSKPLRRKSIAKKSLGSRPKSGSVNAKKTQKGSIYLSETALHSDAVTSPISGKETADREMFEMMSPTVKVDSAVVVEMNNVGKLGRELENKTGSMDDETEAPEDKEDHEFKVRDGENPDGVGVTDNMDTGMQETSKVVQPITIKAVCDPARIIDENQNGAEHEMAVCGKANEPNGSTTNVVGGKGKLSKHKRRPLGKTLRKCVPSDIEGTTSVEVVNEECRSEKESEIIEKQENIISSPAGKTKRTVPPKKSVNSMEVEKENRPVIADQNVSHDKQRGGEVASKSDRAPTKLDLKAGVTDQESVLADRALKMNVEPVLFILSGHKLQRKEFQHVIRRLKGRVCRDSHQWSYQATHFIVPDPIRRTEKFFAAAASGRWILKTDYLTASNQEGKFLAEEPYEWHSNGLSEDGAISLEAPRKWRLLKERNGHGAFNGMRVVIYGDCIAPPLETLKRAIKAGDGTILATSPPYTRFLNSGVDFAIVSPGMPRVDIWVQEFLRHEIPCVVADYLVEYVCKPGYSLERHVQFNTHTWAERSFNKLCSQSEDVVGPTTPENLVNSELQCQVCGCGDRGEEMMICGNQSGSQGCGVGTHIHCCNPPLEHVPDGDWFCPKCSESRNSVKRKRKQKSAKKRASLWKGK